MTHKLRLFEEASFQLYLEELIEFEDLVCWAVKDHVHNIPVYVPQKAVKVPLVSYIYKFQHKLWP